MVAADRSEALLAHVQLDESAHNRGVFVRVPGLDPVSSYALEWEGPVDPAAVSESSPLAPVGPTDGASGHRRGARRPRASGSPGDAPRR